MGPVTRYITRSGSAYDVDIARRCVRQVARGAESVTRRAGLEWRPYDEVNVPSVGERLCIVWGWGRDEHSEHADQFGTDDAPDPSVLRYTRTSPVVEVIEGVITEAA